MESTHDREIAHAIHHRTKPDENSLKTGSLLYQEKNIEHPIGQEIPTDQDLHLHGSIAPNHYIGEFQTILPGKSDFYRADNSSFSPIHKTKLEEDESVVSSTTNEKKPERSSDKSIQDRSSSGRPPEDFHYQSHYHPDRTKKITETAAASSTTTFDDEEECRPMQATSGREKRGGALDNGRPPSRTLGVIKEGVSSSTTAEGEEPRQNNGNNAKKNQTGKENEFIKPSKVNCHRSSQGLEGPSNGSSQTEGRAHYLPPNMATNAGAKNPFDSPQMPVPMGQGMNRSPILSDVSLIPLSPQPLPGMSGVNQFNPNSSLEFYLSGLSSPSLSRLSQARNISPRHSMQDLEKLNHSLYGPPFNIGQGGLGQQGHMPPFSNGFSPQEMNRLAYYQLMQQHQQKLFAMSLDKTDEFGRYSSPLCRSRARKRPLSISPAFSDGLDINTMIRTSPNSLLPYVNAGGLGPSRCSSAASGGSYGHLAAGGISPTGYLSGYNTPMMTSPQLQFFNRQMSVPGYMPGLQSGPMGNTVEKTDVSIPNPFNPMSGIQRSYRQPMHVPGKHPNNFTSHVVNTPKGIVKNPNSQNQSIAYNSTNNNSNMGVSPGTQQNNDDNETVYETNCEWEGCDKEFDTQEQLVQHINNDHIHGDKKEFACHWKDCAREKRPFKAQYMLVVHMRRHTGEKPHKCTFQGCTKAYSRLENLKTHLRSHTGEKPYVCEYPTCTKAFSNASDRAKHQNRTHSNEKPYVCKIAGCTKRYTDPSSLRKHVKTVHGPEAHVTKRMKATKEREERKTEINVKQEPGVEKDKKKSENDNNSKQHCRNNSYSTTHQQNDSNPPSNLNPRSNQSSYASGSDVTPQNSPHMTSQNNDSGVDVNVGANDGDSDGDIIVDENPLPDSTSGGVAVQTRSRGNVRTAVVPRHVSKKMATLSLGGPVSDLEQSFGDYHGRNVEGPLIIKERSNQQVGLGTEVSSTTRNSKLLRLKNYLSSPMNTIMKHRQMALINQERRDSGTVSDGSRKSSYASQNSRKSSQISNAGVNVAGSYDPISLDSSRRSSSNSAVHAMHYGSNPTSLNPYDLHHLQSKFSEVACLPPPTPINGEPYNKSQPSSFKEEHHRQLPQNGTNTQHRFNTFVPTPPPRGSQGEHRFRRRSEEVFTHPQKPPQAGDIYGQNRRASDPIRKAAQMDPNKLPSVQRHNSWNNMSPLPSIQSRNSARPQQFSSNCDVINNSSMQIPNSSGGNSNFYSNENMAMSQQQLHQANFNQYQLQGGVNEQVLANNLKADMMLNCQPSVETMMKNHGSYGNVMSPAANVMSPGCNLTSPQSNIMGPPNDVMQRSPMGKRYPAVNTSVPCQNNLNQPMTSLHVTVSQQQQEGYCNNTHSEMNSIQNHNVDAQMGVHMTNHAYPFGLHQGMPTGFHEQSMPNSFNYHHLNHSYNQPMPNYHHYHQFSQHHYPNTQYFGTPSTHHSHTPNAYANPNQVSPQNVPLTPRPPSHSASIASNRLRLTRMRHHNTVTSQQNHPCPPGPSGSQQTSNSVPNSQISDPFLQQEFIDDLVELQPPMNNASNETQSYTKMAADSTTGPEGDIADDRDDAMSTTNTDVTLPPMSAFSSRLGTPLMNKPYPPQHPLAGNHQHPASNMAINSMSSMLSTLEEENKYLNMMPPQ